MKKYLRKSIKELQEAVPKEMKDMFKGSISEMSHFSEGLFQANYLLAQLLYKLGDKESARHRYDMAALELRALYFQEERYPYSEWEYLFLGGITEAEFNKRRVESKSFFYRDKLESLSHKLGILPEIALI